MGMTLYSCLLMAALIVSSPWWLWRMITSGRYRAGLLGRLGRVPSGLKQAVEGRDVVWLHAVSVGEVIAAERLISELRAALPGWVIAVSTTTAEGQKIAGERLEGVPVFYLPLDFAFTVQRYLRALRPKLLVLMESELWPRLLVECARAAVPVAVVNARISDRSFPRYLVLKVLWKPLLNNVTSFLAQGDESAERLAKIGVPLNRIRVVGNLKYDAPLPQKHGLVHTLKENLPEGREVVVCGSTLEGEEREILDAWVRLISAGHRGNLIIAPRHPHRFGEVYRMARKGAIRVTEWVKDPRPLMLGEILILDTVGQLASVYEVATVAFLGGSLVDKGGHNPLEAARFGVPVVMGPFYENFREVVDGMRAVSGIYIVEMGNLTLSLHQAMTRGRVVGKRGREFFESQLGATGRTVLALRDLLPKARTL
jgi:3-deoxy-D-manno-octulosonic-acid transferase